MSLFAIGIAEVGAMFSPTPVLADRLRGVADSQFPAPADEHRRRGTLLGRIGPLLRRPIDPPSAPARPVRPDVEALLAARAIPPARLGYAWQIVLAWLTAQCWGRLDVDVGIERLAQVESRLASAGVPLRPLGNSTLPLPMLADQRVRFLPGTRIPTAKAALVSAIMDADEASPAITQAVLGFLDDFGGWTEQAAAAGRPPPDLVMIWFGGAWLR